ncbi:ead/Ea22-like family protein [Enterobacter chengduensis]|uniref:ead/Ea22-like family protein n=1 Tax=Enterobacter chengduensis TaxID=2494701 RepID=UPI000F661F05|nr:ead/Ea22-like family protein [Enterobacter chengduensis]RSK52313.1 ead/Ea22-like family protein [Enterobacter chengduensis]
MSNIDKQALREAAEAAIGAHERLSVMPPDDIFDISLAEGTQLDADITALNALNSTANPATVLALLDELEAAEKRIAELEARKVTLPERYEVEMCPTPSPDGDWYSREDVLAALATAGLKVAAAGKGEAS